MKSDARIAKEALTTSIMQTVSALSIATLTADTNPVIRWISILAVVLIAFNAGFSFNSYVTLKTRLKLTQETQ